LDKPNFYAIIPADVRYDDRLKANEKLLYAEITALAQKEGYCWSTNNYFAELFDVTKQTVSGWVSSLRKYGYIEHEVIKNDKGRVLRRKLIPIKKKVNTPIKEKVKENSTSNNITSINKYANEIEKIYNCWINQCKDINNAKLTKNLKEKIVTKLKKWDVSKIIEAIKNYSEIYYSDYYYSHNWTLYKFIEQGNGATRFVSRLDQKYDGDIWKDYKNNKKDEDKSTSSAWQVM